MRVIRRSIGRIMLVALAAGLAGYGLAKLYIWFQARHGVEELARLAAPYANLEWDSVSAGLDGQMQIHGLTIQPRMLNDAISIKSLTIRAPVQLGPEELMHRLVTGELSDSLWIHAKGLTIRADGPLFQRLRQITGGYLWRTPLAALGCEGIKKLDRAILAQPDGDLLQANVKLRLRMRGAARQLALRVDVDLPKLAATTLEATMDIGRLVLFLKDPTALTKLPLKLTSLRIRHTDRGFNASRNLLCASAHDIPVTTFLDRHLAAVRAIYHERKPAPSEALFTQYRDFAAHGGDILLELNFDKPIALAELHRMDQQQLFTRTQFALAINGVRIHSPAEAWYPWISHDRFPAVQETAATDSFTKPPRFHDVSLADLNHHLGERARVITKDGSHHKGILKRVDASAVILQWELSGGYMRFSIAADKIREAQIYR